MTAYLFPHDNPGEAERLALLEQYTNPMTFSALEGLGVRDGWSCVDLGAGRGSVANWLADRVRPTGSVTAVDTDTRHLTSLPNITVLKQDALSFARGNATFDLVHIRFLLVHLSAMSRQELLSSLPSLLKPDGAVVIVESDYSSWLQQSLGDPILDRVRSAYVAAVDAAGWDLRLGAKVPTALEDAGLSSVRSEGTAHHDRAGSTMCRLLAESVRALSTRIQDTHLASEADVRYFHQQLSRGTRGFSYVTTWVTSAKAPPAWSQEQQS